MVTGDYHHTAIAVARGSGMIPGDSRVVIIQCQAEFKPASRGPSIPSALKGPRPASLTPAISRRAVSFHIGHGDERGCTGLRFLLDNGDAFEDGDALRALTSIAQVTTHAMLCYVKSLL